MKTDNKKKNKKKSVRNEKAGGRKPSAASASGSGKKSAAKPAASPPKKNTVPDRSRSIGRVAATTSTGNKLRLVTGNAGTAKNSRSSPYTGSLGTLQNEGGRKRLIVLGIAAALLLTAAGALLYISSHYHVKYIYVEGNVHYTNEEIIALVTSEKLGDNSLYLSLKYKNKGIKGIPFIEKMDVKVVTPDTIRIVVYEKAVAGYVEYLDKYMYFDKDGTVVEASDTKTEGIPQVTGINFNHVVLYEPLPVENQEVFKEILYMTQILSKYEISADKIYFDDAYEMTLYFGDVRAKLGNDDNVEEKIARLKQILPAAEGKKGVFRMENYAGSGSNVSFEQDK